MIPLLRSGLLLGVGMGAFVDGILLHQLLQWHEMLSSVRPPVDLVSVKYNMVWDGALHVLAWTVTLAGIVMMFRERGTAARWSKRVLAGAMLTGWGLFDFVEGSIDHQLLGIHHVHPGAHQLAWDLGFSSIAGLGFIAVGLWAVITGARARPD